MTDDFTGTAEETLSPEEMLDQARAAQDSGDYQTSVDLGLRVIESDQANDTQRIRAYRGIAFSYGFMGDFGNAIGYITYVLENNLSPENRENDLEAFFNFHQGRAY